MISVIIPLYNCQKYIVRAIQSVLSQTYLPNEIIVINDGSTDNSEKLVSEMNLPIVRLINQTNKGVSAARNRGIIESKYEFIAFLDADDEWLPNHIETIVNLINSYPRCGLFASSYYIQPINKNIFTPSLANSFLPTTGIIKDYYKCISYSADTPFHLNSTIIKKTKLLEIGGFPEGIPSGEDILTIARLYTVCDFAYSDVPTSIYHLTPAEGKSTRPILMNNPIDKMFHSLLTVASHRKNVRLFLAHWHKRRVTGAISAKKYNIAGKHFLIAFILSPFYRKLYTAPILQIYRNFKKNRN